METNTPNPALNNVSGALPPSIEDARQTFIQLHERALAFAREQPVVCLLGVGALGFVVGKLAARYS